ncbi:trypsin-like peptidase domain-containing protein [Clostridioides difficile]|nr:trypsin-like peptidase domain-containing protein [Clostridioides difficile]
MKRGKKFFSFILAFTILLTLSFNLTYADEDDNDPVKFVVKGRQSAADMAKYRGQMVYQQEQLLNGEIRTRSDCPSNHYSIINGDDRTRLKTTINQIAFIMIKYKGVSELNYATGFYAAPGKLLTVAHAVIGKKGDKEIEWATAYFFLNIPNSNEYQVASSPIYNAYVTKYYQRHLSKKNDYAVLRLAGEIYLNPTTRLAPLKLAKPNELSTYAKLFPYVCGFPDARIHPCIQHSGGGFLNDEPGNRYYYNIDIEPGQSGSPIFVRDANNQIVVIGIHTDGKGINYSPHPDLNSGLKLRTEIHEFLAGCPW